VLACVTTGHDATVAQETGQEPERATPLTWFAPLPPGIWSDGPAGVEDYMKLFTPSAAWSEAASHTQVFKVSNNVVFLAEARLPTASGGRCSPTSIAVSSLQSNGDR
jgi:hypothetical protein